jgi:cytochrome P450
VMDDLAGKIIQEMTVLLHDRRAAPRQDLISTLVQAQIRGRPITLEELQSMTFLLFLAGLDTVVNALSFGFREFATRHDVQVRLRDDPAATRTFVQELLRMFAVASTPRVVVQDHERFGVQFKINDMVLCVLPAVGRSEAENTDAQRFDIDRQQRSHLAFSTGPHVCIGKNLAELELEIFTQEWLARVGPFRIKAGFKPICRGGTVVALESLPLVWDVAGTA